MKRIEIKCKYCSARFAVLISLDSHLLHNHLDVSSEIKRDDFNEAVTRFQYRPLVEVKKEKVKKLVGVKKVKVKKHKTFSTKKRKIELYSKRGFKIFRLLKCDSCSEMITIGWAYSDTNIGTAHLCIPCKTKVMQLMKQKRKEDGETEQSVKLIYTAFETNRKRH